MSEIPESEPHVRAVWEKTTADLEAWGIAVGLGEAPAGVIPCVVLYPDAGDVAAARLCGQRSDLQIGFILHGIGDGPQQAIWAHDKARQSLLGDPPSVTGRVLARMTQDFSAPMLRDDDVKPGPLYVQTSGYRLSSQAA